MVSHRRSKSHQISRTLLSILTDFNDDAVWMVSTRPLISKSSCSSTNPLVTVTRAPITIGITVTFMFHNFFNSWARFRYLSSFLLSVNFTLWSVGTAKSTILQVTLFCCYCWLLQGLVEIRWSVYIWKSQRSLCVSFSMTDSGLCIKHLFV